MTALRHRKGSLSGLLRLRNVRERDSRLGFAAAAAEERAAEALVADLEHQLATVPTPAVCDLTAFRGRQQTIELIGLALHDARAQLETSRILALAARERWTTERTRLAAVESLIERRAAAARAEQRRRDTRELDEIAGETWRRRTSPTLAHGVAS